MLAKKLDISARDLGDPGASAWRRVKAEPVELAGAPLGMQPSAYISVSRAGKTVGRVNRLQVSSIHNGREIGFHLEWEDPTHNLEVNDTNTFPDGAALLFPIKGDAPLITMGTESQPVNAWHWRADRPDRARNNVAAGLGTTRVTDEDTIHASAVWLNDRWHVVFTRALKVPAGRDEAVQFSVGDEVRVAFAVWEGANGERAGLKAFSPTWHSVRLET